MVKKIEFVPQAAATRLFVMFFMISVLGVGSAFAQDQIDVEVLFERGNFHHISAQFEHTGTVIVDNAGQDQETQRLPLKVVGVVDYDQRFTGKKDDLQAIRSYRKARANIKIDDGSTESKLDDDNQLVVARIQPNSSNRIQMASISDAFEQRELDLIRNPADPLTFVGLFNKKELSTGDRWSPDSECVADFFAVDHIYENEIELVLKSVKNDVAKVYIVGSAKAEVDDVTTSLEVSGIALVDLKKKLVTAMRTTIREDREPGQVAPGFKGQTKIDLKLATLKTAPALSDEALARTKSKKIRRRLKWESKTDELKVTYDPRWRVIASESEAAVLRYIDQGSLMAQCNIVQLPARPANNPLQLELFKSEVEKIVEGEDSASVVKAQELKTRHGHSALRVEVEGVESAVPITWIYYHVSNKDGRRWTFVFTLEQAVAERFGKADKLLVNEIEFGASAKTASSGRSTTK